MVFGLLLVSVSPTLVLHAHAGNDDIIQGVAEVIDAGTLQIDDKVIKLHGLVVPSARQKCKRGSLPWLCGAAARKHLVGLAQGQTVRCLMVSAYHARCFADGTNLSKSVVRNGWAVPDTSGAVYREDGDLARREKLGMWKYAD